MKSEDEASMRLCDRCQNLIVSYFLFRLKIYKAQKGFQLPDKKHNEQDIEDLEEPLMLHTLDIVKNFIDKYSVQSILEEYSNNQSTAQRLIIERHSSINEVKQEVLDTIDPESDEFVVKKEISDGDEFSDYNILDEIDDPIEHELTTSDIDYSEDEKTEETEEEPKTAIANIPDDTAETETFISNNIEFVDRTPEYIVNAYKPSEGSRPKDPDNWIRNKQRNARAKGEEYITKTGKKIPAKRMQSPCKESCRFKCRKKISEEDRQKNFGKYWKLASFIRQRQFIFEHHKTVPVQRRRFRSVEGGKPRQYSSQYFLDKHKNNGTIEQVQVCESMFLKTFNICRNIVVYLHKKVQTGKVQDLRGINRRKLSLGHEEAIEQIKANPFYHIEQPMPITKMYEIYQQECQARGIIPVKNHTYRKLFAEYNECEFLKRDKFICEICDNYYRASDIEKNLLYTKYNEHIQLQEKCMQRAKGRERARKASKRKKQSIENMIVEEHLSYDDIEVFE